MDAVVQTNYLMEASETSIDSSDFFDLLPDPIVLFIFNKLADIKALGRCSVVSKRFCELTPKVENVTLKVDSVISASGKHKRFVNNLKRSFLGAIVKPLQALHLFFSKKAIPTEVSDHSPGKILKNFKEIQHLRIELPVGELVFGQNVLLKWKADFGSTLESCVILGASSLVRDKRPKKVNSLKRMVKNMMEHSPQAVLPDEAEDLPVHEENGNSPDGLYTDVLFKQRVMWTISSIIAASARHYLLRQIISDHPTLESLILTDAAGQGTLCMNKEQLQNLRDSSFEVLSSLNRTQVPALNMRLWYAPHLELSKGTVLKGATLVAIEPSDRALHQERIDFVHGAFEEPFNTVTTRLSKGHTYLLEMNSF